MGWNWEAGGTKEDFLAAIHHHSIPSKYECIVWNSMQSLSQSVALRGQLDDLFDTPPSFHEHYCAISSKPGKIIGGITGLTYDQMKAWSIKSREKSMTIRSLLGPLRMPLTGGNGAGFFLSPSPQRTTHLRVKY